jgi:hypothetical protein
MSITESFTNTTVNGTPGTLLKGLNEIRIGGNWESGFIIVRIEDPAGVYQVLQRFKENTVGTIILVADAAANYRVDAQRVVGNAEVFLGSSA